MTRKNSGFTLVEMLVVMSLLALIMVAMASALRTMAQTEARVDERLQRNDQIRVVNNFLRKTLGRIDITKKNNPSGQSILFACDADSMSWVGIMPARYGAGGRYFFHIALEETSPTKSLVLRYSPWSIQPGFPDWSQSKSHILASDITKFRLESEGLPLDLQSTSSTWPRGWQVGWPVKDAAPQRIRLSLTDPKGTWPPLVMTLMPTLQSQPSSGGFVSGGS